MVTIWWILGVAAWRNFSKESSPIGRRGEREGEKGNEDQIYKDIHGVFVFQG